MKTFKLISVVLAVFVTISCMVTLPRAIIKPNSQEKDEVVMTQELKALLEETPRPKLVIRVSNPPANVTEAEKFNAYINLIEKTLMQNGFTVRDRALLENLMRTGNADYQTISEKIDTDIILDILSLQFDIPNRLTAYLNQTTDQKESFRFPDNYVDCQLAKLECRLTIVKKGQLGGMFTFFASRCDVQDLEFFVDNRSGLMNWVGNPSKNWFRSLLAPIDTEDIKTYFVSYLAYNLMNQLLENINSQIRTFIDLYKRGNYSQAQEIITGLIKKDPRNVVLYVGQALIDAQKGNFEKALAQLDDALQKADVQYQKATTYYGFARVYALKNEKMMAISCLRKALNNGLASFVKLKDIRSEKDLANISTFPEFETLLSEFETSKPPQK